MIDELSKFYTRRELVRTDDMTVNAEEAREVTAIEEKEPRDVVKLVNIFEHANYEPLARRRSRVRSSSIV